MSAPTFRLAGVAMAVGFSACAAHIHPTVSPAIVTRMGELWERPAAFRGAGYMTTVADQFIRRIRQKIDEGQRLRPETAP